MCKRSEYITESVQKQSQMEPPLLWIFAFSGTLVGVDAHIDPAAQTVFTEIQCEFVGTQWGDVGIAPYARPDRFP